MVATIALATYLFSYPEKFLGLFLTTPSESAILLTKWQAPVTLILIAILLIHFLIVRNLKISGRELEEKTAILERQLLEKPKTTLNQEHEKVLKAVAAKSGSEVGKLAAFIGLSIENTAHILDYLMTLKFVEGQRMEVHYSYDVPVSTIVLWRLTDLGHTYIAERNLLS